MKVLLKVLISIIFTLFALVFRVNIDLISWIMGITLFSLFNLVDNIAE